jgi:LmbE family N-acetylglucosaminyl deacetylase
MFIFAHPDDVEFVAGGTAALWAGRGSDVIYVLVTDGNVGSHEEGVTAAELIATRRAEQRAAAELVGAGTCLFLGHHDGLLQPTLALRRELVGLIRRYRPEAVVTTHPAEYFPSADYINHPDHRATATAAVDAVMLAASPGLYPDPEVDGSGPHQVSTLFIRDDGRANYYVDVTDVMHVRLEALLRHVSQFGAWDPAQALTAWNGETGGRVGLPYAESYLRLDLRQPDPEGHRSAPPAAAATG